MMKEKIVCKNLKKTLGKRIVLHDVSFSAFRGKITALLGPNGAGKTTTFSMLCGLIKPDSGQIFLDEKDITELPMYKRARLGIGYLPQEASIFRGLTVEENICAVLEMRKIHTKKRNDTLEKLLNDLSLAHVRKLQAVNISGGERRKLEIARALAANPSFILLDEPLAGIDPLSIEEMRNMILDLKNRGIGIIITDHNVRDAVPLADYVYILFEGKILSEGTSQEIINNNVARKIYLGESFSIYNSSHERDSR
ncbi:MAG: LPS export ABC transporter ATP-binding protein [Holosporaceae bacterium]|jgi:lipopolysaccharide export system ATP-binding protein|nr:LPS export ABC transporter ATP-binding protein [Holosporaceae bacterium]